MSEDILSEHIELTENVRQGGTREREHEEDMCTVVFLWHKLRGEPFIHPGGPNF